VLERRGFVGGLFSKGLSSRHESVEISYSSAVEGREGYCTTTYGTVRRSVGRYHRSAYLFDHHHHPVTNLRYSYRNTTAILRAFPRG
jgi:hypothetical protein